MFINNNLKAIFIHNPKCGGVYVRELLINFYEFCDFLECNEIHENYTLFFDNVEYIKYHQDTDKHTIRKFGKYRYVFSHQKIMNNNYDNYFVFSFVRNPYEKFYSAYLYLKKTLFENENNKIRNSYENKEYFKDLNTFIKNLNNINNISYFHSFITQYEQLLNFNNSININYIGKVENLDSDLIDILTILNLKPHDKHIKLIFNNKRLNVSDNKNILNDYDEYSFNFINEYFKIDFETFGYKIYNSFDEFKQNYNSNNKQNDNLYLDSCLSKYQNLLIKEMIFKFVDICKLLMDGVHSSNTNLITLKELKKINFPESLFKEYLHVIENNILSIMNDNIYEMHKKDISKTWICNNCNFVSKNLLSYIVHSKLCKKSDE